MPFARLQLTLLVAAVLVVLLPAVSVRATEAGGDGGVPLHQAGLVVRHGDGTMTYAVVAFPEDHISGIELLQRSGIEFLAVPFGGLGEGVCQIEREGCEVTECRRTVCQATRSSPYWQYLDQTADHAWRPAPLGASGSRVGDGDVLAWAWSAAVPQMPSLDLADVGGRAGLDAADLTSLGRGDAGLAVVKSSVSDVGNTEGVTTLLGGVVALVVIAGVGGSVLLLRHRQIAHL